MILLFHPPKGTRVNPAEPFCGLFYYHPSISLMRYSSGKYTLFLGQKTAFALVELIIVLELAVLFVGQSRVDEACRVDNAVHNAKLAQAGRHGEAERSEKRRVGKEGGSRWVPDP